MPLSEAQTELWDVAVSQAFTLESIVSVFKKSGTNKRRAKGNGISLLNLLTDYSATNNLESVPIEDVALQLYQRAKDVIDSTNTNNPLENDPFSTWSDKPYSFGHTLFERLQEYLIGVGKIQKRDKTYALKHVRIALGPFSVNYSQPILDAPIHRGLLGEAFGETPDVDKGEINKARSGRTNLLTRIARYVAGEYRPDPMTKLTNASALDLYLDSVNRVKTLPGNNLGSNTPPYSFIGLHNYLVRIGLVVNNNPQKA